MLVGFLIQGPRDPRGPGTLEPWCPGTLEPRRPGTLEPWRPGAQASQGPGTLEPMRPGTLPWDPKGKKTRFFEGAVFASFFRDFPIRQNQVSQIFTPLSSLILIFQAGLGFLTLRVIREDRS